MRRLPPPADAPRWSGCAWVSASLELAAGVSWARIEGGGGPSVLCRVVVDGQVDDGDVLVDPTVMLPADGGDQGRLARIVPLQGGVRAARSVTVALVVSPPASRDAVYDMSLHGRLLACLGGLAVSRGSVVRCAVGDVEVRAVDPSDCDAVSIERMTHIVVVPRGAPKEVSSVLPMDIDDGDPNLLALIALLRMPVMHGHVFEAARLRAPGGVLLHGPPGVGKTHMVRGAAAACGAHMVVINGPEILSPVVGESEKALRERFEEAERLAASTGKPCILFIDELDSLCPPRGEHGHARVVAELLTLLDGAHGRSVASRGRVVVAAATNRPNHIDAALRRPGRLDREVRLSVPPVRERARLLRRMCRGMDVDPRVDMEAVARRAIGFVGADLAALVRAAALCAVQRNSSLDDDSFSTALRSVRASTLRHGALVEPDSGLSWAMVGGVGDVTRRLQQSVEWPLRYASSFARLGLRAPRGVLLYGPPGCSKTTLARIVAATSGCSFIALSGAAIYSPYVGDAEGAVRDAFSRARAAVPAIIFFDEMDALVGNRDASSGDGGAAERVLSTLLNEMDGVEGADGVLVVGATNRLEAVDGALLRPGRFDEVIHVPPPDEKGRGEILRVHTRRSPLASGVDLDWIASMTDGYTGADLEAVCREAALCALRRSIASEEIEEDDFVAALDAVRPSLKQEEAPRVRPAMGSTGSRYGRHRPSRPHAFQ